MSQASVTGSIVAGGSGPPAQGQAQARQLVLMGCSPGGTDNTLYQPANLLAAQSLLDTGPLLEEDALLLGAPLVAPGSKPPPMLMPLPQTTVGAVSGSAGLMAAGAANADVGTINMTVAPHKQIKILCTLGGALATMKVKFSLDGGVTYGVETTSAAAWSSTGYRVPGTNTVLTFGAATYVATKTCTVGTDGVVTNGSLWVGVVTQASSPIDTYELLVTVKKTGALGAITIGVSLCNNAAIESGVFFVPSSGVVVVTDGKGNGTGIVLTLASTFTAGDKYTGRALPPAPTSSDVTTALTALMTAVGRPRVACIHIQVMPSAAASAITLAQAVDTALATAFNTYGLDWQAFVECPSSVSGDIVMSGGVPIVDTADTDAVVQTARVGITTNRVALFGTSGGIVSPITGCKTRRPFGWAVAKRYIGTNPANSLGRVADGPLDFEIGRDEKLAAIQLGDVQINVPTTYDSETGSFLNITSGGFALKNLTVDAKYQDAEFMRALNIMSAYTRAFLIRTLGDRPPVNTDGTIAEGPRKDYSTLLDGGIKRSVGLLAGGDFGTNAQVTSASGEILSTSVLGASPRRLDASIPARGLGMVSAASYTISVQGV